MADGYGGRRLTLLPSTFYWCPLFGIAFVLIALVYMCAGDSLLRFLNVLNEVAIIQLASTVLLRNSTIVFRLVGCAKVSHVGTMTSASFISMFSSEVKALCESMCATLF